MITIVGLGAGDMSQISMGALEKLRNTDKNYLRTEKHPIVKHLDIDYESFDSYYDSGENFEEVYENIARKIIEEGRNRDIVYAVPGHPRVAEKTVSLIERYAAEEGIKTDIIPSMSFVDAMYSYIGFDPADGFSLLDSFSVKKKDLDNERNIIITQVFDRYMASSVKIALMEYYDDCQEVMIVRAAGVKGLEFKKTVPLYDLDRPENEYDDLTSIFIPRTDKKRFMGIYDLLDVTEKLRGEGGCPWDRKQTHETLKKYVIEEAYEVYDAIEKDDIDLLIEELGDLLYQITIHSQIGHEEGYFDFDEVCDSITSKMINRHPHVFGDKKAAGGDMASWEKRKMQEKDESLISEGMKRIPAAMPALIKAQKIQSKAALAGFDWSDISGAIEKMDEEREEFLEAYRENNSEACKEELGDLIFAVAKVARFLGIDAEEALNVTNTKFVDRFEFVEKSILESGVDFKDAGLEMMLDYWNKSKNKKLIKNIEK